MIQRLLSIQDNYSFILFGPRGAGKSTLVRAQFGNRAALWIDLLDPEEEALFQTHPSELLKRCEPLSPGDLIIVDEVQRAPKLLDLAHKLIEEKKLLFGLTGSSARKLKMGAANLLAGRAFTYELYPFSFLELKDRFDLQSALEWGSLPKVAEFEDVLAKKRFLRAYANTYLKEEIQMEQLVRNVPQFRKFLSLAAQMNTRVLNYSKIGRDINCDHSVVSTYFDILEDTLIGFRLPAFEMSIRKQQRKSPKFYFIDTGIYRSLANQLENSVAPGSYEYGRVFESFFISEVKKICSYREKDESLSYLQTKDQAEVDLIVSGASTPTMLIEVKSSNQVFEEDVSSLRKISDSIKNAKAYVVSQDKYPKRFGTVDALPWWEFLSKLMAGQLY